MFHNFVILSGLLLIVFGVATEIAFCRLCMTHFTFLFSSNKCVNYLKYTLASAKYMSSLEVSKLSFVKAQLYNLGFANATFYSSSFKLLVLFASTWLLFTSPTLYSTSSTGSFRHQ